MQFSHAPQIGMITLLLFVLLVTRGLSFLKKGRARQVLKSYELRVGSHDTTYGTWMPIGDVNALSDANNLPIPIQVAGYSLVVWQNPQTSDWSCMEDRCSHRLAPLSEGRVDATTGCIECPYHGWQFATNGACTKVPQEEKNSKRSLNLMANAMKTHLTGDMLWVYMPLPGSNYYPELPEEIYPELLELQGWTSRDLPYSWDFLVENFMDPAHIPFAHHSLQGVREDGSPIPMEVLTSIENATHCEVRFWDVIRGKAREGTVSFRAPVYYHFRIPDKNNNNNNTTSSTSGGDDGSRKKENKILTILTVPVSPGRSRVHLCLQFPPDKEGKQRNPIPAWVPLWFIHGRSNNFLDSDIWVYDQERNARERKQSGGRRNSFTAAAAPGAGAGAGAGAGTGTGSMTTLGYLLPTSSDLACSFFRRWWSRHLSALPPFGPTAPEQLLSLRDRHDLTDRFRQHTSSCYHCRTALTRAHIVDKWSKVVLLGVLALARKQWLKALAAAVFLVVQSACGTVRRATLGPTMLERTSAAQFPEKKWLSGKRLEEAVPRATTADTTS